MTAIMHGKKEYERLPMILLEKLPGFEKSPEYELIRNTGHNLPSVVCGAMGSLLVRLQGAEVLGELSDQDKVLLLRIYETIEELAQSDDDNVVNSVVVDVFEPMNCSHNVRSRVRLRLGPKSKELYDRWVKKV